MSLLFIDGFTHYSTSQIPLKWKGGSVNTPIITGSAGRVSGDALVCVNAERVTWVTSTPLQEIIIGLAHKVVTDTSDTIVLSVENIIGSIFARVEWITADDKYELFIKNGSVGTTSALVQGDWNYLELKIKIDNVSGTYELKVNEATALSGSNFDTTPASIGVFADVVHVGGIVGTGTHHFDDVYIADTTGVAPQNDFLGDVTVETNFPDTDGTTTNFTPLSGSNVSNVLETNHDGDSSYNSSSTATNKDTLNFPDLTAATGAVYGVQTHFVPRKTTMGTRTMSDVIRTNSTDFDGTTIGIGNDYKTYSEIHETNPDTSSAWTIGEINSAEFGYKIQA